MIGLTIETIEMEKVSLASSDIIQLIESTEANIKLLLCERFIPLIQKIKTVYEDYIKTLNLPIAKARGF